MASTKSMYAIKYGIALILYLLIIKYKYFGRKYVYSYYSYLRTRCEMDLYVPCDMQTSIKYGIQHAQCLNLKKILTDVKFHENVIF